MNKCWHTFICMFSEHISRTMVNVENNKTDMSLNGIHNSDDKTVRWTIIETQRW